jgi:5-methylcytosine-specific restriction endonuclease McrA
MIDELEKEIFGHYVEPIKISQEEKILKKRKYLNVYHKNNYRKIREQLIKDMGSICVKCGSDVKIEIDHIHGRDWDVKRLNRLSRIKKYAQEWKEGKVRLLCKKCNQFRWREEK